MNLVLPKPADINMLMKILAQMEIISGDLVEDQN